MKMIRESACSACDAGYGMRLPLNPARISHMGAKRGRVGALVLRPCEKCGLGDI